MAEIEFSEGDWLLVFEELIHDTFSRKGNHEKQILQIIDDERVLDSLKDQFRCIVDSVIDGSHEYVINLYKDGKEYPFFELNGIWQTTLVFNDRRCFDFREMDKHFRKGRDKIVNIESEEEANREIEELTDKGWYVMSHRLFHNDYPDYTHIRAFKYRSR